MSGSSGYGSNGSNNSSSFNGSNAAAESDAGAMGSDFSSSLNGGSLAGSVPSSMASRSSHATCTSAGTVSVARSNDAAKTNQEALVMQVDAEPDSAMGSSVMNSSASSLSGDTVVASLSSRAGVGNNSSTATEAPMSAENLALYNSVLTDIRSGLLQLPRNSAPSNTEANLRVQANLLLQQSLANRGFAPSGQTLMEMRRTVDTFCRLAGWLQSEETLENATIEIDYQMLDMPNGSAERIRCKAADNVKSLQEAISARVGPSSAGTRQLICNGEPMTDQTQCLYRFVARRGQGMRHADMTKSKSMSLTVQEVVRVSSG